MFSCCYGLTNITIPNSLTTISAYAFAACNNLTNVTIPNSVTMVEAGAFMDCIGLTNVRLGNSVSFVDYYAFSGCNSLTALYSFSVNPPDVKEDNFTDGQYKTLNVYVPEEALKDYQNADVWKEFWNLQTFNPAGIKPAKATDKKAAYYDLRGYRLTAPKRGLTIVDGKKVFVK